MVSLLHKLVASFTAALQGLFDLLGVHFPDLSLVCNS